MLKWENVDNNHQRAKIYGGWPVKTFKSVCHRTDYEGFQSGWGWRVALCFVPDPEYKWIFETPNP